MLEILSGDHDGFDKSLINCPMQRRVLIEV